MPKKPSQPLGHIVFPKTGPPEPVREDLPTSKQELEQVIAEKFVAALGSRFDRRLSPPRPGDEWPDVWTAEGGTQIGIEIVEVVNPDHVSDGLGYGTPQPVAVDRANELLAETIFNKIGKKYQPPNDWALWLVAYDVTCALSGQHDVTARLAHAHLQGVEHAFDEIWLIWPTAGDVPSFLVRLAHNGLLEYCAT